MALSSWIRRAVLGVGLGLIVAACGDDDDGSSSASNALLTELCGGLDDCCKAQGKPNSVDACVQLFAYGYQSKIYDDARGQACLAAMKQARQDGLFCSLSLSGSLDQGPTDEACTGVFTRPPSSGGSVQPGGACTDDTECALVEGATDATCTTNFDQSGASSQYCEVTVMRAPGGDCGAQKGYETSCNTKAGDTCDYATKKCVAAKTEGEDCAGSSCAPGLYCALAGSGFACTKQLPLGSACDGSDQDACITGSYCADDKTCSARLANGSACTSSDQCLGGSCPSGKCASGASFTLCTTPE